GGVDRQHRQAVDRTPVLDEREPTVELELVGAQRGAGRPVGCDGVRRRGGGRVRGRGCGDGGGAVVGRLRGRGGRHAVAPSERSVVAVAPRTSAVPEASAVPERSGGPGTSTAAGWPQPASAARLRQTSMMRMSALVIRRYS